MKPADKLLLHSIDAATPGGAPYHAAALAGFIVRVCSYLAVFVVGYVAGML
jgi:hypothetical protein